MNETERLWLEQLHELNRAASGAGLPPRVVAVVANSEKDAAYWEQRVVASGLLGATASYGIAESQPLGNLQGTIAAWQQAERKPDGAPGDGVGFLSIVIGKGTRLSPFTQALGNRKAAFPTPRACGNASLGRASISEVANWALRPTAGTLANAGFRGWIVKWGDEVILPDRITIPPGLALEQCDVIRFASGAEPNDELALHKEWLVIDPSSGLLLDEIPRQTLAELRERLAPFAERGSSVSVNLGSFCATPAFFAALAGAFAEPLASGRRGTDWDPWFWVAWCCPGAAAWEREKQRETARGRTGITQVETRTPDFFARVHDAKARFAARHGRPARIGVVDLGRTLWVDYGNHAAIGEHWNALRAPDGHGQVLRALYGIPEMRDARGNIVTRGEIEGGADVRDSVIVDAVIPAGSVIRGGIVIGGRHGRIHMPEGGAAIESHLEHLECGGPGAVSFRSLGNRLALENGSKHTTLVLADRRIDLRGSDAIRDYSGASYTDPVLGNPISFEEAGRIMEAFSLDEIDALRAAHLRSASRS